MGLAKNLEKSWGGAGHGPGAKKLTQKKMGVCVREGLGKREMAV